MSESLSLFDILLLKDDISVWEYVLFSYIIPVAVVLAIVAVLFIWAYRSDIKCALLKPFRRSK